MRPAPPLLAVCLIGLALAPTRGQEIERETFQVLGWNDACSVAVAHYGYPFLGQAAYSDPIQARLGTLTIAPGEDEPRARWTFEWSSVGRWQPAEARRAAQDLAEEGYDRPSVIETIRPGPVGPQPGLDDVLLSTAVFALRRSAAWPETGWRWSQLHYSPLDSCALFVFTQERGGKPFYRAILARLYNPAARKVRSRAHVTNALLSLDTGDLATALAETATAAAITPSWGLARYHHAAMLALSGAIEEAISELAEAIRLDQKYKAEARDDAHFENLRRAPRFRALVKQ